MKSNSGKRQREHRPLAPAVRWRTPVAALAMSVLVVAGAVVVMRGHAATRPIGKLSPASGAYWGIYSSTPIATRESQVGRTFAIQQKYYAWTDSFPMASENDDVVNGRIPLITWNPETGTSPLSATPDADIANGVYDANIISHAEAVRSFGHPIFLRFGAEMNGNWNPWSGTIDGNTPAEYVAAWRHVHDLFVQYGATNAVWVWCPNATDVPSATSDPANHWTNYYPGDNYVDWVGIDGYNWGSTMTGSSWQTFASVFGNGTSGVYADYAATKPIMIAETGSAYDGAPAGTSKAQWMLDMATSIQNVFPSIEAVVYFDTVSSTGTREWPIDTDPTSLANYTADGKLAYFNPPINMGKKGDLNLDGQVNVFDLSIMLSDWGDTNHSVADLNGDNVVNIFDLSTLLSDWGT